MSSLTPNDYVEPPRFRDEQRHIRDQVWHFAGLRSDVAEHTQYIVLAAGGQSIIVQNFHGELRAFTNVCTHRGSRLRSCRTGAGPLRCPYHGWTFDERGIPVGIPHKRSFPILSSDDLASLALESWQVGICGTFVFVAAASVHVDLQTFLGSYHSRLEAISKAIGMRVDENELTIAANWKIAVENTLESYHVDLIHPETFKRLGAKGQSFEFESLHSSWTTEVGPEMLASWKRIESKFSSRPIRNDNYEHIFIFPTMTLASSFGMTFAVQTFEPVSVSSTQFRSRVFLSSGSGNHKAFISALAESTVDFNRRVFEEDRKICEQVQLGLGDARRLGPLSEFEGRVAHFQRSVLSTVSND
jgi:phenylpropionate dioxygenase-like ring-hydroxylating dioxygenase large terminal subunit